MGLGLQKRGSRLDYKANESWPFSGTKLIWGILFALKQGMQDKHPFCQGIGA